MRVQRQWLLVLVPALVVVAQSCGPDAASDRSTASIGPSGGTLTGPKGASVVVPNGAVSSSVTLTAETASSPAVPPDVDTVGSTLVLGPEGQKFSAPVEITLIVDESKLPAGTSLSDVVIFTAPVDSEKYEDLGGTAAGSGKVKATTTHFSKFVPVVRKNRADGGTDAGTGGSGGGNGGASGHDGGTGGNGGGSSGSDAGSGGSGGSGGSSGFDAGAGGSGGSSGTDAGAGGSGGSSGFDAGSGGSGGSSGFDAGAGGSGGSSGTDAGAGGSGGSGGSSGFDAGAGGSGGSSGFDAGAGGSGGSSGADAGAGGSGGSDAGSADAGFVTCPVQQFQSTSTCTLIFSAKCAGETAQCGKDAGACTCMRDGGTPVGSYSPGVDVCASPFQYAAMVQAGCGFP
ncbi:MAG: hypothetical protein K1X89_26915 [Myxococcaceae bacterium]|nr:hypothetical protein [Myxococcaceae bacterium]